MSEFLRVLVSTAVVGGWIAIILNGGSILIASLGTVALLSGFALLCVIPERGRQPRPTVSEILAELEAGKVVWRPVGEEAYIATRPDDRERFLEECLLPEGTEPQVSGPPARYIGIYKVP